jgi:hypothetical protein
VQAVPTDRDTTHRLLLEALEKDPTFEVKAFPEFIGIHIAEPQRRFWSPRLFLSLDPEAAGGTRISGTYGPEIEIWGIFLYGYLITGLIGTFSAILGFAQRVVESDPWGFWVAGGMGGLALLLYLAAQLGQKLGAWQTFQLHQAYQAAIGGRAEVE